MREPLVARDEDGRQARPDKGRRERGGKRRGASKDNQRRSGDAKAGAADPAQNPTARTEAEDAGGVADGSKGTKAGDGGRWVHVPG